MSIRKTFTQEAGLCYVAPSVSVLDCQNEGLLCVSYGDANEAGKSLNQENEWDF